MNEKLLNIRELAEKLNMSTSWVRVQLYKGALPHHRLGRSVRFVWEEVAEALGLPVERQGSSAEYKDRRQE